ncbi:TolC family protein, partial [Bacteroidota bacterium]
MYQYKLYKYLIIILFSCSLHGMAQEKPLSLSLALEKALENNYGIIISKSDTEIASINNNWGQAGKYPTIGFNASSANSYNVNDAADYSMNRLSSGLSMQWTVFSGFKVKFTKNKLEQLEELAKGSSSVVVENTIDDVIMAYYQVLLQKEKLSVLEIVMKLSNDRYNYEQKRLDLAVSFSYNVLQAKNLYLNDKALYMNQEVIFRNSIRNLNFLMALPPEEEWIFTEKFEPQMENYSYDDLLSKLLDNNSLLKNQYLGLLLKQTELKLNKSEFYPKVNLSTGMDNTLSNTNRTGMDPTNSNSFNSYGNLSLSYNLYTGGSRKRAMEISKINEEVAQIEIDEMKHILTNQLINTLDYYDVRKLLFEVAEESMEAADLNLKIADDKLKTGAINSFNYRDIQMIYLNTAIRRLESIYNLIDSRTALTK